MKLAVLRQHRTSLCIGLLIIFAGNLVRAQGIPQQNVNAIGPTPVNWLLAGNARKQQNEPECAVSPGNPNWLFCGYNDYRAVDFAAVGDAFPGVSMSRDGGRSWISGLHPGHLADTPSLGQQFGADANISAVPNFLLYNFIAGWRNDEQPGGVFVSRWYEHNRESGPPWEPLDIITIDTGTAGRFLDKPAFATSLANTADGLPDVVVPIPQYNDPRNPANVVPAYDLSIPAGRTHLVYSVFVGNDNNDGTKIMYRASDDWGQTWPISQKLSESSEINQGASIATRNFGKQILVVWRRFSDNNESSAIMMAFNNGNKWTKPEVIAEFCAFDQTTGSARFRTNALPVVTSDGNDFYVFYADRGPGGLTCFHPDGTPRQSTVTIEDDFAGLKDGQVPMAFNYARIMMVRSSGNNKLQWSNPVAVDPQESSPGVRRRGHQFMPAVATAGGISTVSWFDSRRDKLNLRQPPVPGAFVEDYVLHVDGTSGSLIPASTFEQVPPPATLPPTSDNYPFRRTLDVYGAQIIDGVPRIYLVDADDYVAAAGGQSQTSVRISRFAVGKNPVTNQIEQLEFNYPNGRLFRKGKAPFIGDYNSVFAAEYREENGSWLPNHAAAAAAINEPTFHVAWTSNRNVRGPVYYNGCDVWDESLGMWVSPPGCASNYGAPNVPTMMPLEGEDGEDSIGTCSPATPNALTRNQNIFVAALRPELSLSVVSAVKSADGNLRAYVLQLTNASPATRTATLSVPAENPARASFKSDDTSVNSIPVVLPGRSSVVRTIFSFVNANSDPTDDIIITLEDPPAVARAALEFESATPFENVFTDDAGNPIPVGQQEVFDILLDKDRIISTQSLDLENLDLENTVELLDLENLDLENLDLENRVIYFQDLQNLDLENLDLENLLYQQNNVEILDLENLDLENRLLFLDLENLDLENLDLGNLDLENLDLENFTIFASDVENLDLENLDLENLDLENTAEYTEVSWQLKTETNTTTGIDVKPIFTETLQQALANKAVQIFVTSAYETSTVTLNETASDFCAPKVVVSNQVLYNSVLPPGSLNSSAANPDPLLDPSAPSFLLEPDQSAVVTLRFYHDGDLDEDFINNNLGVAMYSQGDSVDCDVEAQTGDSTIIEACEIDNPDTTPPVLDGIDPPVFVPTEPFVLAANANTFQVSWGPVTATDNVDTDIVVECTPGVLDSALPPYTFVHDFMVGDTTVTCSASDTAGNEVEGTFVVSVADETAPVITLIGDNPQTVIGGMPYEELGATAIDNVDGDISSGIIIDASAVDTDVPGSYSVSYASTDSSGNSATEYRTVIVTDTTAPVITVNDDPFVVGAAGTSASVDYLSNVSATDNVDGDVPVTCTVDNQTEPNPVTLPLGSATIDCSASDAAGNTATAQFTVNVVFAYAFELDRLKGNIKAGSVVPLDWRYRDPDTGALADSSGFSVMVIWRGPFTGANCSGSNTGTGDGMAANDAGSSAFRYAASQSTWQYSWQTPAGPGAYEVEISPPGGSASTTCVTLR
ncbi:MAG: immunoglobulin-like domain-containing protein [Woeseia sp.]